MFSALKNLIAPKKKKPNGFSGTAVMLMVDSRNVAKLSESIPPAELIDRLNRLTTALISSIEKNEGTVHLYVGGSLIAYWPPSKMPAAVRSAIGVASDAIAEFGTSIAVSIAVAELALADVGPTAAKRPLLIGVAYQRADATLRLSSDGAVAVDVATLEVLPTDIKTRFVLKDGHAELR